MALSRSLNSFGVLGKAHKLGSRLIHPGTYIPPFYFLDILPLLPLCSLTAGPGRTDSQGNEAAGQEAFPGLHGRTFWKAIRGQQPVMVSKRETFLDTRLYF